MDKYIDDHKLWLKKEYEGGSFVASGKKIPRTEGIILSNIQTTEDLWLVLAKDPFYKEGVDKYDVIPKFIFKPIKLEIFW